MIDRDIRARTVKDFCHAYGIGRTQAYELMGAGVLSVVKAGTRTLILEESAKAWLDSLPRPTYTSTHIKSSDFDGQQRTDANALKKNRSTPQRING